MEFYLIQNCRNRAYAILTDKNKIKEFLKSEEFLRIEEEFLRIEDEARRNTDIYIKKCTDNKLIDDEIYYYSGDPLDFEIKDNEVVEKLSLADKQISEVAKITAISEQLVTECKLDQN